MYTVKLIFDLEKPDSEDQEVRDYLDQRELEPRYLSTADLDGRQCQIMQFGGCYLLADRRTRSTFSGPCLIEPSSMPCMASMTAS